METSKNTRLLFAAGIFVLSVTLVRLWSPNNPTDGLLEHPPGEYWIANARKALSLLGVNEGYVTINPPTESPVMGIFLFDSESGAGFQNSRSVNKCAYLGDGKTIICDVAMIRQLSKHLGLDKKVLHLMEPNFELGEYYYSHRVQFGESLDDADYHENQLLLLTWIIGHEIGHLIARHVGAFHFDRKASHNFVNRISMVGDITDVENQRLESDADAYVVRLIDDDWTEALIEFLEDSQDRLNAGNEHRCSMGDSRKYPCRDGRPLPTSLAGWQARIQPPGSHPALPKRLEDLSRIAQARQLGMERDDFQKLFKQRFE
ncbi:hypothetical protein [Roseovarius sp. D22-M7]|uniref:hypothetical protein n=1 Tax=Roseovarius sp. D22-M7 TaxID=3127116 RepID=UPI00300FFC47